MLRNFLNASWGTKKENFCYWWQNGCWCKWWTWLYPSTTGLWWSLSQNGQTNDWCCWCYNALFRYNWQNIQQFPWLNENTGHYYNGNSYCRQLSSAYEGYWSQRRSTRYYLRKCTSKRKNSSTDGCCQQGWWYCCRYRWPFWTCTWLVHIQCRPYVNVRC